MRFLAVILLFICAKINAATYYVATTGSDANAGTIGAPWLTLTKAESVVVAGDLVLINNGSYAGFTTTKSGASGNVITFQALNSGSVNITSTISVPTNFRIFTGFSFTNVTDRSFNITGANNIMLNMTINISFTPGYGIVVGVDGNTGGSSANNNIVDGLRLVCTSPAGQTVHGVIFGGGCTGNILRNSYISNSYYGIVDKVTVNSLVYNNVFNMTGASLNTCAYAKGNAGGQYYNNVFRSTGSGYGVLMNISDGGAPPATGIVIKNNIFVKNNADPSIFNASTSNTFTSNYNLFQYTSGVLVLNQGGTNYSTLATWQSASGQDANSIAGTPLFVNTSGSLNVITDFKQATGSPAINAGVAIAGRTTDAGGNAITGTPTIGPWQYISVAPTGSIYYIATNGDDSRTAVQAQNINTPWRTLQKISSVTLNPGDIVYIRAGTYPSGATNSPQSSWLFTGKNGNSTNPILISAYPPDFPSGGRVVFDNGDFQFTSNHFGINIQNSSWIIFRGIRVTNIPQRVAGQVCIGWWVNGNAGGNITLDNCEADHIGNTGFRLDNTNNANFLNCDAHHIDNPFDPGIQRHGGADGFGRYDPTNTSTNTLYKGCRGYWCSDDSWDCFGSPGTITYDSCWAFYSGYVQDVFPLTHTQGGIDWGDGNGIKLGSGTTPQNFSTTTRTVTRCFAFENYRAGFDQNDAKIKMVFYNNTSYSNANGFFLYASAGAAPMTAMNNLAYNNSGFNQNFIAANTTQSNNSWNGGVTVTNADFLSVTDAGVTGPRQGNGTLPNLTYMHIAPGSDLINAGINVGLPFTPPAPDIGAFPHATSGNIPPTANAGPDQSLTLPPPSTTLNGTASFSTSGTITSYTWSAVSGPASSITTPNTSITTVTGLTQGSYTYRLTVVDSQNLSATDDVVITVDNPTIIKYYGRKL